MNAEELYQTLKYSRDNGVDLSKVKVNINGWLLVDSKYFPDKESFDMSTYKHYNETEEEE